MQRDQPARFPVRHQNHRHAGMDGLEVAGCRLGEQRTAGYRYAVGPGPDGLQAGKGDHRRIGTVQEEGLSTPATRGAASRLLRHPLVPAPDRHQAARAAQAVAPDGLARRVLGARVERQRRWFGLGPPGWNQAPPGAPEFPGPRSGPDNDRDLRSRRHVEHRFEPAAEEALDGPVMLAHDLFIRQYEAPAHVA